MRKTMLLVLTIAVVVCACIVLAACGNQDTPSNNTPSDITNVGNNNTEDNGTPASHTHTYSSAWAHDADYHWHDATCGHDVITAKAVHDWHVTYYSLPTGETMDGIKVYTCSVCGATKTETIPASTAGHVHTYSELWTRDDDYHWHDATCGHDVVQDKAQHTWDGGTVTLDATETSEGEKTYTCTICGATKVESIDKLPHVHTYADTWTTDATYHWHDATCGHDVVQDKAQHTWDGGTVTLDATETSEGEKTYTCTICGATKVETIDKLPHVHTYADTWTTDATYHWHAATCGHDVVQDKAQHTWDGGTVTLDATETSEGEKTYTCTICGATKVESIDKLPHVHTYADTWTTDATYHWHAATCGHDVVQDKAQHTWDGGTVTLDATEIQGEQTTYICTVCNATKTETTSDPLPHTHIWDNGNIVVPTCTEQGYTLYTCSCGETYKDNYTNALGHSYGEPSYSWSANNTSCTATRICNNDRNHIETETSQSIKTIKQPKTCTQDEMSSFSASFTNPAFAVQTKENVKTAEKGHTFDKQVATATYLYSEATCTQKAKYYYSCVCGEKGTKTFESGQLLPHVYDKEVATSKYSYSAATCTQKARYYHSCKCGAKGTSTFEYGNLLPHTYDQKVESSEYLYAEATSTTGALYFYSCKCGAKGTNTFEHVETYTIKIALNGGKSNSYTATITVANSLKPTDLFFDVTKENGKFIGWSLNDELIISNVGQIIRQYSTTNNMTLVATFKDTCKLTINKIGDGQGSVVGAGEYYYYENVDLYAYPNDGYTFAGWYYNDKIISNSRKYSYKMEDADRVVEARFDVGKYALRIASNSSNNGIVAINPPDASNSQYEVGSMNYYTTYYYAKTYSDKILYNARVTVGSYTKSTTQFLGWYDIDNNQVSLDPVYTFNMPSHNYSLVAKWSAAMVTDFGYYFIEYDLNGGTNYYNNPTSSKAGSLSLFPPEKVGYDFDKWNTTSISKDTTLVASWKKATRTITYNLDGGTNNVKNPTSYSIDAGSIRLEEPTKKGYCFIGWTGTNTPIPTKSITIDANEFKNYEFTANWQPAVYSISYNLNGGTNDSRNATSYRYGDSDITLYNPTRDNYTFAGWKLNGESVTKINCNLAADIVLDATWTAQSFSISYKLNGGTASNPTSYTVETVAFTLTAPTKTGYEFLGWTGSNGTTPQKNVTITKGSVGNKNYTANWELKTYTITYVLNDGTNNANNNKTTYTVEDSNITLYAPSRDHYNYVWQIDGNAVTTINTKLAKNVTVVAVWTPIEYTITYRDFDGATLTTIQVTYQGVASYPASTPIRASSATTIYSFSHWVAEPSSSEEADLTYIDCDRTVYAYYTETPRRYAIQYNLNGGTEPQDDTYQYDEAKVLPDAVRAGYIFQGWYTDPAFAQDSQTTQTAPNSYIDYVVYARWSCGTAAYTTQYYQENVEDDGYTLFEQTTETGTTESTVIAKAKTYTGFTYDSSNTNNSIMGAVVGDGSLVLRRYYKRKTYTVTFDANGGDLLNGADTQTIKYQAAAVAPTLAKAGYTYVWDKTLVVTASATITAIWTPNDNNLHFEANGATAGDMDAQIIATNSTVSLHQNLYERAGYQFQGWAATADGDVAYPDEADYTMGTQSDYTLYAVWSANTYVLTFDGNNATSGEMDGQNLQTDQVLTLPAGAYARTYYTFVGWALSADGSALYQDEGVFAMLPHDTTLYAVWQADRFAITYHLDGGTNGANPATYTVEDAVDLDAATKTGYTFAGWYTDDGYANAIETISLGSHGALEVYAKYTPNRYTVTYHTNGGTAIDAITLDYDTALALPVPTYDGHIFKGWYLDDQLTEPMGYSTMPARDIDVYAQWVRTATDYLVEPNDTGYTILGLSEDFDTTTDFELVIPATYDGLAVTEIGELAFANLTHLKALTIPDSVTTINSAALFGCSGLTTLTIPFVGYSATATEAGPSTLFGFIFGPYAYTDAIETDQYYSASASAKYYIPATLRSVTVSGGSIRYGAFYGCSRLTSITIPKGVKSIGKYAFYGCSGLTSITIPDSVTSIGGSAFYSCSRLTSVTIPDSVTSIGGSAFGSCRSLKSITIPFVGGSKSASSASNSTLFGYIFGTSSYTGGTATKQYYSSSSSSYTTYYIPSSLRSVTVTGGAILYGAFSGCSGLTSVTIPEGVTSIGDYAFGRCSGLTSITIPGSVTTIGENAFYGCSGLTSITIPDSVNYIKDYAFRGCRGLTSITIPDSVTSIGDSAFSGCSSMTSVTIGSVTTIGEDAFYGCSGLTSVTIGSGVKSVGRSAFGGCSSLKSITIPFVGGSKSASYASSSTLFGYIFGTSSYTGGTETRQFYDSSSYTDYYIPSSLRSVTVTGGNILYGAFYSCSGLTSITIGDGVTSIRASAFWGCSGLTSVTIGSVTTIGEGAFRVCRSLESITIPFVGGSKSASSASSSTLFGYIFGTSSYTGGTETKQYYASSSYTTYYIPSSLHSVTVTGGAILYGAFSGCSGLTSITIPDSVTSIGGRAFSGCTGLTGITIPDSVTSIGSYAFYNCTGLTSVTIPDSVTSIGGSAFWGCNNLEEIRYAGDVAGWCAISGINNLLGYGKSTKSLYINGIIVEGSFTIPEDVTSIGSYAFYNCTGLTSVTIPDSVTSIGESAFFGCYRLVEVYNQSSLAITAGSSNNGYVAYYAKNVYSIEGGSNLSLGEDGYLRYTDGDNVSLIAYRGLDTDLTIPNDITEIYQYAFYGCRVLTSITIPDSVTAIGSAAFADCSGLSSIKANTNNSAIIAKQCNSSSYTVTIVSGDTIASSAFENCSGLTSVNIPDSVTSIGRSAFGGCSSLESITIPFVGGSKSASGESSSTLFGYIFGTSSYAGGTATKQYYGSLYYGSSSYTTYYIPSSLHSVTVTGGAIPYCAFENCSGLTSITIPDSVTSIRERAFENCSRLTSITIPDSVTSIGEYAFYGCSGLTSVTIGSGVKSIGSNAFYRCSNIEEIRYTEDIAGWYAISGLSNLMQYGKSTKTLYIDGSKVEGSLAISSGVTTIQSYAFYGCSGLTSVTIGSGVKSIGSYAFFGCSGLTSVTIGSGVKSIGSYAFYGCSGLTSVTIGSGVTSIGGSAFSGCTGLTSVTIPAGVTSIGGSAFSGCTGLTSVTIPAGVTSIGGSAFSGCTGLTSVTIPDSVTSIGEYAFHDCSGLTSITIPGSVNSIGGSAFYSCSRLTSVTIGSGVTSIGDDAFEHCRGLTSITIPDSVTSIGYDAFYDCSRLTSIEYKGTKAQWSGISKGSCWNYNTGKYTIHCTDGDIAKS